MIKYIQFNKQFDADKMQQEVAVLEASFWKAHYNRSNYEGSWTTLQLRSINGLLDNNTAIQATALQGADAFRDTALLAQCNYIQEVLAFFEMEKTAVRLMKLNAGAIIKPHHDANLNFEEGEVRIHIPVLTHDKVKFMLQEEMIRMREGSCWYMNLSLQHSVINESEIDRVHLVIDGLVNDWFRAFMQEPAHATVEYDAPDPAHNYSLAEKLNIIAHLRQMKTEKGDQLADEMQATLDKEKI